MLEKRKTRTREALALMWCAGQLPEKNLAQGLRGLLLLKSDNSNRTYDHQSSFFILSKLLYLIESHVLFLNTKDKFDKYMFEFQFGLKL